MAGKIALRDSKRKHSGLQIHGRSLLCKLMAMENLKLVIDPLATTARIDMETRTVYLPNWDVVEALYDYLTIHEVSHALHTPMQEWLDQINKQDEKLRTFYHSVMNIVEDARIDKLIQRRYPGARRWYRAGTEELVKTDFFERNPEQKLPDGTFPPRILTDRLNVHFKTKWIDTYEKQEFSAEEEHFVPDMENLETFDDTIRVTEELFKYSMENGQFPKGANGEVAGAETVQILVVMPGGRSDGKTLEEKVKELEAQGKKVKVVTLDKLKKIAGAETVDQLQAMLEGTIIKEKTSLGQVFLGEYNPESFTAIFEPNGILAYKHAGLNFFNQNKKLINFCVAEFERKKKAKELSRTQESKVGILDMKNLHRASFDDNVFVKNEITSEHKNHGFIFFIDLSSSMLRTINQVFKQVLILSMFCKQTNIPFEVYGLTDMGGYGQKRFFLEGFSDCTILKFFDHKYSNQRILEVCDELLNYAQTQQMGATPLTASLAAARNMVDAFKSKYRVDVLNFILLSDGGCNQGNLYGDNFITDNKTHIRLQASEAYSGDQNNFISPILEMIRARSGARVTIYYLLSRINISYDNDPGLFYEKGFKFMRNKFGADKMYYVNASMIFNNAAPQLDENNQPMSINSFGNEFFLMKNFISEVS